MAIIYKTSLPSSILESEGAAHTWILLSRSMIETRVLQRLVNSEIESSSTRARSSARTRDPLVRRIFQGWMASEDEKFPHYIG